MGILQGAGLGCLELQDADGDTVYLPLETVAAMAFGPSVSRRFQLLQEETRLQTLERERKFGERHRRIALHRHYNAEDADGWAQRPPAYCTMRASQDLSKLAPTAAMAASGRLWNKPPKLGEAYQHFFGEDLSGAHDALVDVVACKRIYLELERRAEG